MSGQVSFDFRKSGEVAVLAMSGALTVENANDIKGALLMAFNEGSDVHLKLNEIRAVDLSFIQVLCASSSKARKESRAFRVYGPGSFVQSVEEAGFPDALISLTHEEEYEAGVPG